MSLVVNTNVSSLTAQRSLAESADMLDKAMARLSSGKRRFGGNSSFHAM